MVPPVQFSWPLASIVRSPVPSSVPLFRSRLRAVTAPPRVSLPPLIRVVPAPVMVVPVLRVKILVGNCSAAPAATSKLPVLVPPKL